MRTYVSDRCVLTLFVLWRASRGGAMGPDSVPAGASSAWQERPAADRLSGAFAGYALSCCGAVRAESAAGPGGRKGPFAEIC